MPSPAFRVRALRLLAGAAGLTLAVAGGLYLARRPLTRAAVDAALRRAGAGEVRLDVAEVTPWRVVLANVVATVRQTPVQAARVTIERPHWWSTRIGTVRVERTSLVVDDRLLTEPADIVPGARGGAGAAVALPESLAVDGTMAVRLAEIPGGSLDFSFAARAAAPERWEGSLQVRAEGLSIAATGGYHRDAAEWPFQVGSLELDLGKWQAVVRQFVTLPDPAAELAGTLTGTGQGRWTAGGLSAGGRLQLRDGHLSLPGKKLVASGVEYAAEFPSLVELRSQPGVLRAKEVRVGELDLRNLEAEVAFEGGPNLAVSRASFQALGGSISAEPFGVRLDRAELAAVVMADGLDVAQITALAKDLPARASGRVDGRLPIRIDESGLRFGTGWLALKPGVAAELQFNAKGLLTGGADPKSPAYAVLEKVESGLLRLKVGEMRLEVYPPGRPPGRSAQLHLTGEPVDPDVKAPVVLDLNVNGPLERLISLGLDSRAGIGATK